ncbi:MAG: rubrerythrin family protein [Clostridia bacterium]|nr:rubrerythrin family protein [Clostridia bacterium]
MLLANSNTKINLMKAFAGESQARNRYIMSGSQAKKENLNIIEKVFNFTANQEFEHAKLFYKYLSELHGESINITADFPVDIYNNTLDLLKCAQNNEYAEYNNIYKSFGDEAKQEGFIEISEIFYKVADIEKIHGDRFSRFINLIESKKLFESDKQESWVCLNCGHIHVGSQAPEECPVCKHNQGYYCTNICL